MRARGRGLKALVVLSVVGLAGILAATALSSDDPQHPYAGNWTTSYPESPTSGTINFRLVSDAEGSAALVAAGGMACPEPTDYYRGTFTRGSDSGTHVGCVAGGSLGSRWHSNGFGTDGRFSVIISSSTSWTGSYRLDDDPATYEWSGSFAGHFPGDGAQPPAPLCEGFGVVVSVGGPAGGVWVVRNSLRIDVEALYPLCEGDELHTGDGSSAIFRVQRGLMPRGLGSAESARVAVDGSTTVTMAGLTPGSVDEVEVWLKEGGVEAQVSGSQPTNLTGKTATLTASGGSGTEFGIDYDAAKSTGVVSVTKGEVAVTPIEKLDDLADPAVPRGPVVTLTGGNEVQVSATGIGAVAPVGESVAPLTKAHAIARVKQILRTNAQECELRTRSVTARATAKGFKVTARVVLDGKRRTAVWNVAGATATGANALARRIARGCP